MRSRRNYFYFLLVPLSDAIYNSSILISHSFFFRKDRDISLSTATSRDQGTSLIFHVTVYTPDEFIPALLLDHIGIH